MWFNARSQAVRWYYSICRMNWWATTLWRWVNVIIRLKVFEQTLSIVETKSVPRKGSKEYLLLQFVFSSDWDNLNDWAEVIKMIANKRLCKITNTNSIERAGTYNGWLYFHNGQALSKRPQCYYETINKTKNN